ncbi:chaoptin-like [Mytilus trossulus]|uniref:chaoptin-like n=1 Tax=Mytilus trossulus TaxID=6551 RepID=UPI003004B4CA
MDLKFNLRFISFIFALNCWILLVTSKPCTTLPSCECDENETLIKCENIIGLSILSRIRPSVVSLTVKNSFLGPTLNASFSSYIMEVEEIDLSHSRIHSLTVHVFKYLRNLSRLVLKNNFLRILKFEVFDHLTALEELDLSHNRFGVLPDGPFHSLISLRFLNVSFNNLTNLKFGLRFQVMESMQSIDLSGNKFQTISNDSFEMTANWRDHIPKVMNLSYCGIENIQSRAFRYPKGMETLILKGNEGISYDNLTSLFNSSDSPKIKNLDLTKTGLTEVSELFSSLRSRNIKELTLSHNEITLLSTDLSENLAGTLLKFDMRGNKLTAISGAVSELRDLQYLDLSENLISEVDSNFNENLIKLKYLNLAHNKISAGKLTLQNFVDLETLDLSYNQLTSFIIPQTLIKLQTVNLAGNGISTLESLDGLINLENFYFQQNKLTELKKFLFVDSPIINIADFSGNEIQEIDGGTFEPHSPRFVDLSYNQLKKLKFPGWTYVKSINLRGNYLENLHGESFYALFQLEFLDLAENALLYIDDNLFLYLTNLTTLHLEHNQLLGISNWKTLFRALISLKYIDFSYNNLTRFDTSILSMSKSLQQIKADHNRIHNVDTAGFKSLTQLQSVDFSTNYFVCNCDLINFRNWLQDSGVMVMQKGSNNYTCKGPPEQTGIDVFKFEIDDFECDFMFLYIVVYSCVGGVFVVVVIITSFVCHYHLKWRRAQTNTENTASIDFERMERVPFIPDGTILRKQKTRHNTRHKTNKKTQKQESAKVSKIKKKKKNQHNTEMYIMNGNVKLMNGKIPNGIKNGKTNNKATSKGHSKKTTKKKRHNSDPPYLLRQENELVIPKPRRKTYSDLEMNPYVQQFLLQQHKKQMKNMINKRYNRESFRNVDIIRPVHGSRSSPDFKYNGTNTLPKSHTVDYRLNEHYPEMTTWHGSRGKQNKNYTTADVHQMEYVDNKHKMSGYNTISGVPSHRSHAQYI